jgi:hypothetical protein
MEFGKVVLVVELEYLVKEQTVLVDQLMVKVLVVDLEHLLVLVAEVLVEQMDTTTHIIVSQQLVETMVEVLVGMQFKAYTQQVEQSVLFGLVPLDNSHQLALDHLNFGEKK